MAKMYPKIENINNLPYSEKIVYNALAALPDTFTVFHSVQWFTKGKKKSIWKENDFLILSKKYGMLVLEVKGGDIDYKDGVFIQINKQTKEKAILSEKKHNDPLTQAKDGKYHYQQVIDDILKGELFLFNVEPCVCFSGCDISGSIDSFPLLYREVQPAILDNRSINNFYSEIKKVYEFYDAEKQTKLSDEQYRKIVRGIAQDFQLVTVPSLKKGELDDAFIRFTNEQIGFLDYISEQEVATIQGVAGTGKTVIALEAARRFSSEGSKVLFLCFNRLLYNHLEKTYPIENVQFYNIHTFISQYVKGDFSSIENRVDALYQIDKKVFKYDDIIIDEAQDFDNNEILYFKDYLRNKDGRFLVFYDKNQLLTTKEVPEWILNSECKLVLTKNCRNTAEIAKTSYNVIDVELKQKVKMISGDQPNILFFNDFKNDLIQLINTYIGKGYDKSDITLLTVKTEQKSLLNGVTKLGNFKISNVRSGKDIFFTTASKFKGLEGRVIIILDIDDKCFSNDETKRLFYVACSRATHQLALVVDNDKSVIDKIASSIDISSAFSKKGKIVMKVQAKIIDFDEDF